MGVAMGVWDWSDMAEQSVTPEWIIEQRERGWPDMHPEDYCHRCGNRNPLWYADQAEWLTATSAWAAETGREGICCPTCFAEMHKEATGRATIWHVAPHDRALLAEVLAELYTPEGVGLWWQTWLQTDPRDRHSLERNIIAAADGAFL